MAKNKVPAIITNNLELNPEFRALPPKWVADETDNGIVLLSGGGETTIIVTMMTLQNGAAEAMIVESQLDDHIRAWHFREDANFSDEGLAKLAQRINEKLALLMCDPKDPENREPNEGVLEFYRRVRTDAWQG